MQINVIIQTNWKLYNLKIDQQIGERVKTGASCKQRFNPREILLELTWGLKLHNI